MRKYKMILALCGSVILLLCIGGWYTLAYLNQTTVSVTNEFNGSTLDLTVKEDFQKGDKIKKHVTIQNTGNVPMYVRVKFIVQAQNEQGNIIANPIVEDDLNVRGIKIEDFNISERKNWIEADGYYYYPELIEPEQEVLFFESASLKEDVMFKENYVPVLTITAQGVQANAIVCDKVWDNIEIDENNTLTISAAE